MILDLYEGLMDRFVLEGEMATLEGELCDFALPENLKFKSFFNY